MRRSSIRTLGWSSKPGYVIGFISTTRFNSFSLGVLPVFPVTLLAALKITRCFSMLFSMWFQNSLPLQEILGDCFFLLLGVALHSVLVVFLGGRFFISVEIGNYEFFCSFSLLPVPQVCHPRGVLCSIVGHGTWFWKGALGRLEWRSKIRNWCFLWNSGFAFLFPYAFPSSYITHE